MAAPRRPTSSRARARGSRTREAAAASEAPAPPRRAMLRFVATFAGVAIVLFALYQWTEATAHFRRVNELNAAACTAVLRLCGIDATHTGTTVHVGVAGMEIIGECSAIYVLILFTAAVIAFPTTWRARLRGLAVGLPILLAVNVLRLVTLGAVVHFKPTLLPLFHEYLWQVLFVLLVAGLYLLWMEKVIPRARVGPAA